MGRDNQRQSARECTKGAGEGTGDIVARKDRGQVLYRHGLGKRGLLDRQEQADVAGGRIEGADHRDEEQRPKRTDAREADAGRDHQDACSQQQIAARDPNESDPERQRGRANQRAEDDRADLNGREAERGEIAG
jgi:hypothetical protein